MMLSGAWREATTSEKGRCLVANRNIEPLEIILQDQAAVVAPDNLQGEVCVGCLQELQV